MIMILEKFKPSENDTWTWRLATMNDVDAIVALAQDQFQREVEHFITPDPQLYATNLFHAVVNQTFDKCSEQLIVAVENDKLIGYAWIQRGVHMPFSREEMAEARFIHTDQKLPKRKLITLLAQILQQWELWAQICGVKVICSSTIRSSQDAFLKLHEQAGYSVRGSIAFKRLSYV
jgi:hypothetical protein